MKAEAEGREEEAVTAPAPSEEEEAGEKAPALAAGGGESPSEVVEVTVGEKRVALTPFTPGVENMPAN